MEVTNKEEQMLPKLTPKNPDGSQRVIKRITVIDPNKIKVAGLDLKMAEALKKVTTSPTDKLELAKRVLQRKLKQNQLSKENSQTTPEKITSSSSSISTPVTVREKRRAIIDKSKSDVSSKVATAKVSNPILGLEKNDSPGASQKPAGRRTRTTKEIKKNESMHVIETRVINSELKFNVWVNPAEVKKRRGRKKKVKDVPEDPLPRKPEVCTEKEGKTKKNASGKKQVMQVGSCEQLPSSDSLTDRLLDAHLWVDEASDQAKQLGDDMSEVKKVVLPPFHKVKNVPEVMSIQEHLERIAKDDISTPSSQNIVLSPFGDSAEQQLAIRQNLPDKISRYISSSIQSGGNQNILSASSEDLQYGNVTQSTISVDEEISSLYASILPLETEGCLDDVEQVTVAPDTQSVLEVELPDSQFKSQAVGSLVSATTQSMYTINTISDTEKPESDDSLEESLQTLWDISQPDREEEEEGLLVVRKSPAKYVYGRNTTHSSIKSKIMKSDYSELSTVVISSERTEKEPLEEKPIALQSDVASGGKEITESNSSVLAQDKVFETSRKSPLDMEMKSNELVPVLTFAENMVYQTSPGISKIVDQEILHCRLIETQDSSKELPDNSTLPVVSPCITEISVVSPNSQESSSIIFRSSVASPIESSIQSAVNDSLLDVQKAEPCIEVHDFQKNNIVVNDSLIVTSENELTFSEEVVITSESENCARHSSLLVLLPSAEEEIASPQYSPAQIDNNDENSSSAPSESGSIVPLSPAASRIEDPAQNTELSEPSSTSNKCNSLTLGESIYPKGEIVLRPQQQKCPKNLPVHGKTEDENVPLHIESSRPTIIAQQVLPPEERIDLRTLSNIVILSPFDTAQIDLHATSVATETSKENETFPVSSIKSPKTGLLLPSVLKGTEVIKTSGTAPINEMPVEKGSKVLPNIISSPKGIETSTNVHVTLESEETANIDNTIRSNVLSNSTTVATNKKPPPISRKVKSSLFSKPKPKLLAQKRRVPLNSVPVSVTPLSTSSNLVNIPEALDCEKSSIKNRPDPSLSAKLNATLPQIGSGLDLECKEISIETDDTSNVCDKRPQKLKEEVFSSGGCAHPQKIPEENIAKTNVTSIKNREKNSETCGQNNSKSENTSSPKRSGILKTTSSPSKGSKTLLKHQTRCKIERMVEEVYQTSTIPSCSSPPEFGSPQNQKSGKTETKAVFSQPIGKDSSSEKTLKSKTETIPLLSKLVTENPCESSEVQSTVNQDQVKEFTLASTQTSSIIRAIKTIGSDESNSHPGREREAKPSEQEMNLTTPDKTDTLLLSTKFPIVLCDTFGEQSESKQVSHLQATQINLPLPQPSASNNSQCAGMLQNEVTPNYDKHLALGTNIRPIQDATSFVLSLFKRKAAKRKFKETSLDATSRSKRLSKHKIATDVNEMGSTILASGQTLTTEEVTPLKKTAKQILRIPGFDKSNSDVDTSKTIQRKCFGFGNEDIIHEKKCPMGILGKLSEEKDSHGVIVLKRLAEDDLSDKLKRESQLVDEAENAHDAMSNKYAENQKIIPLTTSVALETTPLKKRLKRASAAEYEAVLPCKRTLIGMLDSIVETNKGSSLKEETLPLKFIDDSLSQVNVKTSNEEKTSENDQVKKLDGNKVSPKSRPYKEILQKKSLFSHTPLTGSSISHTSKEIQSHSAIVAGRLTSSDEATEETSNSEVDKLTRQGLDIFNKDNRIQPMNKEEGNIKSFIETNPTMCNTEAALLFSSPSKNSNRGSPATIKTVEWCNTYPFKKMARTTSTPDVGNISLNEIGTLQTSPRIAAMHLPLIEKSKQTTLPKQNTEDAVRRQSAGKEEIFIKVKHLMSTDQTEAHVKETEQEFKEYEYKKVKKKVKAIALESPQMCEESEDSLDDVRESGFDDFSECFQEELVQKSGKSIGLDKTYSKRAPSVNQKKERGGSPSEINLLTSRIKSVEEDPNEPDIYPQSEKSMKVVPKKEVYDNPYGLATSTTGITPLKLPIERKLCESGVRKWKIITIKQKTEKGADISGLETPRHKVEKDKKCSKRDLRKSDREEGRGETMAINVKEETGDETLASESNKNPIERGLRESNSNFKRESPILSFDSKDFESANKARNNSGGENEAQTKVVNPKTAKDSDLLVIKKASSEKGDGGHMRHYKKRPFAPEIGELSLGEIKQNKTGITGILEDKLTAKQVISPKSISQTITSPVKANLVDLQPIQRDLNKTITDKTSLKKIQTVIDVPRTKADEIYGGSVSDLVNEERVIDEEDFDVGQSPQSSHLSEAMEHNVAQDKPHTGSPNQRKSLRIRIKRAEGMGGKKRTKEAMAVEPTIAEEGSFMGSLTQLKSTSLAEERKEEGIRSEKRTKHPTMAESTIVSGGSHIRSRSQLKSAKLEEKKPGGDIRGKKDLQHSPIVVDREIVQDGVSIQLELLNAVPCGSDSDGAGTICAAKLAPNHGKYDVEKPPQVKLPNFDKSAHGSDIDDKESNCVDTSEQFHLVQQNQRDCLSLPDNLNQINPGPTKSCRTYIPKKRAARAMYVEDKAHLDQPSSSLKSPHKKTIKYRDSTYVDIPAGAMLSGYQAGSSAENLIPETSLKLHVNSSTLDVNATELAENERFSIPVNQHKESPSNKLAKLAELSIPSTPLEIARQKTKLDVESCLSTDRVKLQFQSENSQSQEQHNEVRAINDSPTRGRPGSKNASSTMSEKSSGICSLDKKVEGNSEDQKKLIVSENLEDRIPLSILERPEGQKNLIVLEKLADQKNVSILEQPKDQKNVSVFEQSTDQKNADAVERLEDQVHSIVVEKSKDQKNVSVLEHSTDQKNADFAERLENQVHSIVVEKSKDQKNVSTFVKCQQLREEKKDSCKITGSNTTENTIGVVSGHCKNSEAQKNTSPTKILEVVEQTISGTSSAEPKSETVTTRRRIKKTVPIAIAKLKRGQNPQPPQSKPLENPEGSISLKHEKEPLSETSELADGEPSIRKSCDFSEKIGSPRSGQLSTQLVSVKQDQKAIKCSSTAKDVSADERDPQFIASSKSEELEKREVVFIPDQRSTSKDDNVRDQKMQLNENVSPKHLGKDSSSRESERKKVRTASTKTYELNLNSRKIHLSFQGAKDPLIPVSGSEFQSQLTVIQKVEEDSGGHPSDEVMNLDIPDVTGIEEKQNTTIDLVTDRRITLYPPWCKTSQHSMENDFQRLHTINEPYCHAKTSQQNLVCAESDIIESGSTAADLDELHDDNTDFSNDTTRKSRHLTCAESNIVESGSTATDLDKLHDDNTDLSNDNTRKSQHLTCTESNIGESGSAATVLDKLHDDNTDLSNDTTRKSRHLTCAESNIGESGSSATDLDKLHDVNTDLSNDTTMQLPHPSHTIKNPKTAAAELDKLFVDNIDFTNYVARQSLHSSGTIKDEKLNTDDINQQNNRSNVDALNITQISPFSTSKDIDKSDYKAGNSERDVTVGALSKLKQNTTVSKNPNSPDHYVCDTNILPDSHPVHDRSDTDLNASHTDNKDIECDSTPKYIVNPTNNSEQSKNHPLDHETSANFNRDPSNTQDPENNQHFGNRNSSADVFSASDGDLSSAHADVSSASDAADHKPLKSRRKTALRTRKKSPARKIPKSGDDEKESSNTKQVRRKPTNSRARTANKKIRGLTHVQTDDEETLSPHIYTSIANFRSQFLNKPVVAAESRRDPTELGAIVAHILNQTPINSQQDETVKSNKPNKGRRKKNVEVITTNSPKPPAKRGRPPKKNKNTGTSNLSSVSKNSNKTSKIKMDESSLAFSGQIKMEKPELMIEDIKKEIVTPDDTYMLSYYYNVERPENIPGNTHSEELSHLPQRQSMDMSSHISAGNTPVTKGRRSKGETRTPATKSKATIPNTMASSTSSMTGVPEAATTPANIPKKRGRKKLTVDGNTADIRMTSIESSETSLGIQMSTSHGTANEVHENSNLSVLESFLGADDKTHTSQSSKRQRSGKNQQINNVKTEANDNFDFHTTQLNDSNSSTTDATFKTPTNIEIPKKRGRKRKSEIEHDLETQISPIASAEQTPGVMLSPMIPEDWNQMYTTPIEPPKKRGRRRGSNPLTQTFKNDSEFNPRLLIAKTKEDVKGDGPIEDSDIRLIPQDPMDVQCALCMGYVGRNDWSQHLRTHYGIGWVVGMPPTVNIKSRSSVLNYMIEYFKTQKIKSLSCRLCQTTRKSALGLLTHIEQCCLTEEEIQNSRVECTNCKNLYAKSFINSHIRICVKEQNRELGHENPEVDPDDDTLSKTGRIKRKSVVKAEIKFKNMETPEIDPDEFIQEIPRPEVGPHTLIWQRDLQFLGRGSCFITNCRYNAPTMGELQNHIQNNECKFIDKFRYLCTKCNYRAQKIGQIRRHIANKHNIIKDSSFSDIEIKSEPASLSEFTLSSDEETECEAQTSVVEDGIVQKKKERKKIPRFRPNPPLKDSAKLLLERMPDVNAFAMHNYLQFTARHFSKTPLYTFAQPKTKAIEADAANFYLPKFATSMKFNCDKLKEYVTRYGETKVNPDEWKELNMFDGISFQNEHIAFMGGPVTCTAWAPIERGSSTQYLAVTLRKSYNKYPRFLETKYSRSLIVIQKYTFNKESKLCAEVVYAFTIESGPVHCLAFMPSGGYAPELNRLGLLAVGTIETNINIYSLPLETTKKDCDIFPIIRLEPSFVLCLDPAGKDNEYLKDHQSQCSSIVWSKDSGHKYIVAGFINGYIGIWDVSDDEDNLQRMLLNGIRTFIPASYFWTGDDRVVQILIHYDFNGLRWMCAFNVGRRIAIFDIQQINKPTLIHLDTMKNMTLTGDWPVVWENPSFGLGYDMANHGRCVVSVSPMCISYIQRKFDKYPCGVNSMNYNSWTNTYVGGAENGDIHIVPLREGVLDVGVRLKTDDKVISTMDIVPLNGGEIECSLDRCQREENFYDPNVHKQFGVLIGQLFKFRGVKNLPYYDDLRSPPLYLNQFIRVNQVQFNPNYEARDLLAVGYENGFLRVLRTNY